MASSSFFVFFMCCLLILNSIGIILNATFSECGGSSVISAGFHVSAL